MPGPGQKKSKSKKPSGSSSASSTRAASGPKESAPFLEDIENADGWGLIINVMCDYLQLPDLSSRSGLKKAHTNFDAIYRRLDQIYQNNLDNEKILGAVVGIYAKMCADSLLRNKLFKQGVLSKIIPLLDKEYTRLLALRSLSSMTHHGGEEIRVEIARKTTPTLLKLLQDYPDNARIAELAIVTMSHSVGAAINVDANPDAALMKAINIPLILRLVTRIIQKEWASRYLLGHASELLASPPLHAPQDCLDFPSVIAFHAAALRSKDLAFRVTSLGALFRLHVKDCESDQRGQDPRKMLDAIRRGYPQHLSDILMDYGPQKSDVYMTLNSSLVNQRAFMRCLQDRDLYALGATLAPLVLQTEFSIANGFFQTENPRTGKLEVDRDLGLPFFMWTDALPHCAKAMRAKGTAQDIEMADILDVKYMVIQQRIKDAIVLAKKAMERSPQTAYWYYIVTLSSDPTEGLRSAKKGMKCKKITPFVRCGLLHRAVDHAGHMGLDLLLSSSVGEHKWEEGIAFLMSALEDGKAYVDEAPPDARHMKNVMYWYILLTLAIKGPEISPDLQELQECASRVYMKKLKAADEFGTFIGIRPPKTQLRLAQQTVVKYYTTSAAKDWAPFIAQFDSMSGEQEPISITKAEQDLAAWLDDLHIDEDGVAEQHPEHCSHPKISFNRVELYRCSWCRNPSAVLRKCSGCEKTRYCDAGCQKAHWATHKAACKAAPSS